MKPIVLGLLLTACAAPQQPAAARYPSLPAAPAPAEPAFEPGALLTSLPLVCEPAERSVANALDDDCNGRIDDGLSGEGAPTEADVADQALVLAFSYPQSEGLKLGLRSDERTLLDVTPAECGEEHAFCTGRVATRDLPRGRHTLVASLAAAHGSGLPVVVSTQSHGKITTSVATVGAGPGEQVLGQLVLP